MLKSRRTGYSRNSEARPPFRCAANSPLVGKGGIAVSTAKRAVLQRVTEHAFCPERGLRRSRGVSVLRCLKSGHADGFARLRRSVLWCAEDARENARLVVRLDWFAAGHDQGLRLKTSGEPVPWFAEVIDSVRSRKRRMKEARNPFMVGTSLVPTRAAQPPSLRKTRRPKHGASQQAGDRQFSRSRPVAYNRQSCVPETLCCGRRACHDSHRLASNWASSVPERSRR